MTILGNFQIFAKGSAHQRSHSKMKRLDGDVLGLLLLLCLGLATCRPLIGEDKAVASNMGHRKLAQAPDDAPPADATPVVLVLSPPPPEATIVFGPPPAEISKKAADATATPPPPASCGGFLSFICGFVEPIVSTLGAIPFIGQFVQTIWGFIKSFLGGIGGGGGGIGIPGLGGLGSLIPGLGR